MLPFLPTNLTRPEIAGELSVSLNTVEFFPDGAGTKMLFTEHATFINGFDDPDAAGRKEGSEGLLDRLAAFLAD